MCEHLLNHTLIVKLHSDEPIHFPVGVDVTRVLAMFRSSVNVLIICNKYLAIYNLSTM